jgi:hypothetical protein
MREKMLLICPTTQRRTAASDWLDGQTAHGAHTPTARRAELAEAVITGESG